jgi:hypothetical protein
MYTYNRYYVAGKKRISVTCNNFLKAATYNSYRLKQEFNIKK